MTLNWAIYASLALGLSSALVAGVFQAFSDFVMPALVRTRPEGAIEAMQMINRTVFRSVFLVMLLGLTPLSLGFAAYAYFNLSGAAQVWIMIGAVIYVVAVFLVTMLGNVPMNNRLDNMPFAAADTATYWQTYGRVWTGWNHVRTLGSLVTATCFLVASVTLAAQ